MYSKGNIEGIVKKFNQFAESLTGTDFVPGPDATSQFGLMAESLAAGEADRSVTSLVSCVLSCCFYSCVHNGSQTVWLTAAA